MDFCPVEIQSVVTLYVEVEWNHEVEAKDESYYPDYLHSRLLTLIVGDTQRVDI